MSMTSLALLTGVFVASVIAVFHGHPGWAIAFSGIGAAFCVAQIYARDTLGVPPERL